MLRTLIATDYAAVFLLLLTVVLVRGNRVLEPGVKRSFRLLIACTILRIAVGNAQLVYALSPVYSVWRSVFSHLSYLMDSLLLVGVLMISARETPVRFRALIAVPFAVLAVLLAVSFFGGGCIASFHADTNIYKPGPLHAAVWLVPTVYLVLIVVSPFARRTHWQETAAMLLAAFSVAGTMVTEVCFGGIAGMQETAIAFAVLAYYLYFQSNIYIADRVATERRLNEARISAMVAQIHPHFVCNALGCIAEICHEDAEQAERSVLTLAAYLRTHYKTIENEAPVSFRRELESIRCYTELERQVLGDRLTVVIDTPETGFSVPELAIETLVENAIRHGVNRKRGPGTVRLTTARIPEGVRITVEDDGAGFDPNAIAEDGNEHIGLHYARTRLTEQCNAAVTVTSSPGKGCKVEILIPKEGNR
ncbi:MAG: histidine kinase [Clostridia bacterium]|nr:histidine kinase [Clostridia bacterium]